MPKGRIWLSAPMPCGVLGISEADPLGTRPHAKNLHLQLLHPFLLVGLEIKREVLVGELSSVRNAALPVAAALGGAVVPALIYLSINAGTAG